MTDGRQAGLAVLLIGGSFAAMLAGVRSDGFDLERHLVPKELALHLTAFLGILVLRSGRPTFRPGVVELLLVATLVLSFLSALLADNRWLGFRAFGIGLSAFVVFLMARALTGSRLARPVLVGVSATVVAGALTGLAQAYGVEWDLLSSERLPGGTFGNRNFLAHVAVIGLPTTLFLALEAERPVGRALATAGLLLLVAAIVLTRSRAAWLAAGAALGAGGVALLARARAWRAALPPRRPLLAGLALGAGIGAAIVLPNRLTWRSESPYRDSLLALVNYREGSGRGRIVQYRNSLALAAKHPVWGVGPGNWFVHYPTVTTEGDPSYAGFDPIPTNPWPSSDWVAFATEIGVPGTVLLLLAGVSVALIAWRRAGVGDPWVEGTAVVGLAVLTAAVVAGAFDAVVHLPAPAFLVAVSIGLLLPGTRPVLERQPGGAMRVLAIAGPPIAIGLLVLSSLGQLAAIRLAPRQAERETLVRALRFDPGNHRLHLRLAQRGSCRQRLPHARAAAELLPYHSFPRRLIARCD